LLENFPPSFPHERGFEPFSSRVPSRGPLTFPTTNKNKQGPISLWNRSEQKVAATGLRRNVIERRICGSTAAESQLQHDISRSPSRCEVRPMMLCARCAARCLKPEPPTSSTTSRHGGAPTKCTSVYPGTRCAKQVHWIKTGNRVAGRYATSGPTGSAEGRYGPNGYAPYPPPLHWVS